MRENAFGEVYCHSVGEIADTLSEQDVLPSDSYVNIAWDEDADSWMAEVLNNEDGEIICYVEGFDSRETLRQAFIGIGYRSWDVNFI